jgi:hypothetical protein
MDRSPSHNGLIRGQNGYTITITIVRGRIHNELYNTRDGFGKASIPTLGGMGVDECGQVVMQKRVSRSKLRETIAQLPAYVIGIEACGSAQYWAREFQ